MARRKPNLESFAEPSTRTSTLVWTPDRIRQAEILADGGNFALAADLGDALLGDDEVQGALSTLVGALTGLPLSFEAAGDRRRSRRAVRALEADEDWWTAFPESELRELLTWAVIMGFAVGELDWTADPESGRVPGRLKVWHPRSVRWDAATRGWFVRVGDRGGEMPIAPGDGRWVIFTPGGGRRAWRRGAYRALARWWLLKDFAIRDWGFYSERHGTGILVAESDIAAGLGGTLEKRKKLVSDLNGLGRNTSLALPAGWKLKLLEATANTAQTFEKQIALANQSMRMALHGTTMTNEQGGSYAKAQVLNGVRLQVITSLAEALATAIHDQHLTYWAEFNFGDRRLAPWPKWDASPPADVKAEGEALGALATACSALRALSPRVDVDAILEEHGVPLGDAPASVSAPQVPPSGAATPPAVPDDEQPVAAARIRLARSLPGRTNTVRGQVYADAVADAAREKGAKALAPTLRTVLDAIEKADDYEALRGSLVRTFEGLDGDTLGDVVERAVVLAELGGRLAVRATTVTSS